MQGVLDALVKRVLLRAHPVGCVYTSLDSTSPETLFGGTWTPINGRFLIGTGTPENNDDGTSPGSYNFAAGSKGGEAQHTLTVNEMPAHSHNYGIKAYLNPNAGEGNWQASLSAVGSIDLLTDNTGGNQPHNSMPPYMTVYMWKRTA